jgi:glycosyltransferase involved in cell wall biosynthesis
MNIYSLFNSKSEALIGGAEVQLFNLAKYFSYKYQVNIITGDWGQESDYERFNSVKVWKSFSLDKKFKNYIKAPFLLWKRMAQIDAAVYIISSAGVEVGLVGFFCKITRKKFIYRTAHEVDCNGEYIKNNGWRGKLYQYGLRNANVVVTQNIEHQKLLLKKEIKSVVIRNSFEIANRNVSIDNKKYIFWLARCDDWKNPEMFMDIVRKFPEEQFIMISPRSSKEDNLFNSVKKEALVINNLKFIERVAFFESQKYYDEAKLFIGTSEFEGFPNTYIQACLGRTPIVSYKVNPDNFVTKNNLGYCADGDFEIMLQQIKKILEDNTDWREKSDNAFAYAQESHNISINGKKWDSAISNLINN